jgi:DNA-binding response OmpR family regulator
MLTECGYQVLEAGHAGEALALARGHDGPIYLLLTDVVMPGVNGAQLAARLASLRAETRVLYMSGYTDEALGHHGVLDEGIDLLMKPFTAAVLAARVREVLDRAEPGRTGLVETAAGRQ